MKQYGMIEPCIVKCKRARSHIIFNTVCSIIIAIIAIVAISMGSILQVIAEDLLGFNDYMIGSSVSIGISLLILDVIQIICYHIGVHTTVLGISRHFIAGHTGWLNTHDVISPISKVKYIKCYSSWIDKIFGATTIIVSVHGHFGSYMFRWMDTSSVEKFINTYQKCIIVSGRTIQNMPET